MSATLCFRCGAGSKMNLEYDELTQPLLTLHNQLRFVRQLILIYCLSFPARAVPACERTPPPLVQCNIYALTG
jgi:hypothetical protein